MRLGHIGPRVPALVAFIPATGLVVGNDQVEFSRRDMAHNLPCIDADKIDGYPACSFIDEELRVSIIIGGDGYWYGHGWLLCSKIMVDLSSHSSLFKQKYSSAKDSFASQLPGVEITFGNLFSQLIGW